jgi:hypothetical protein
MRQVMNIACRPLAHHIGHEPVHAFRLDWQRHHRRDPGYGFVEAGFAVLMATRLEPDSLAFPIMAYPSRWWWGSSSSTTKRHHCKPSWRAMAGSTSTA